MMNLTEEWIMKLFNNLKKQNDKLDDMLRKLDMCLDIQEKNIQTLDFIVELTNKEERNK